MGQMKAEDDEIDTAAEDYQKLKAETQRYEMDLKEQADFLQQEQQANQEAELNCEKLERNVIESCFVLKFVFSKGKNRSSVVLIIEWNLEGWSIWLEIFNIVNDV